jgi:hypothetical protein
MYLSPSAERKREKRKEKKRKEKRKVDPFVMNE